MGSWNSIGGVFNKVTRGVRTVGQVSRQSKRGNTGGAVRSATRGIGREIKNAGRDQDRMKRREYKDKVRTARKEFNNAAKDRRDDINKSYKKQVTAMSKGHEKERDALEDKYGGNTRDRGYRSELKDLKREQKDELRGLSKEKRDMTRGLKDRDAMEDYIEKRAGPKPDKGEMTQTGEVLEDVGRAVGVIDRMMR